MEKILDMTVEFSKYMQQGILVVNLFIDEYLYLNSREHDIKILELLQWMTCISITGNIFFYKTFLYHPLCSKKNCKYKLFDIYFDYRSTTNDITTSKKYVL